MSLTVRQKMHIAREMVEKFETTYEALVAEGRRLEDLTWEEFEETLVEAFQENPLARHLAHYALADAKAVAELAFSGLPEETTLEEKRRLLHANAGNIVTPPASATDSGKILFLRTATGEDVFFFPHSRNTEGGTISWYPTVLDEHTSPHSGCPALNLQASEAIPWPGKNPVEQLFHLTVEVIFNNNPEASQDH